jgi:hypothetical protein
MPTMPGKEYKRRKNTGSKKSQKTVSGNLRTLRPRLPVTNYVNPDSEDEDLEECSEGIKLGHLCTSADPSRVGAGGETIILRPEEIRKVITIQQSLVDQSVWLTTDQAGFPLTTDKEELVNSKDTQLWESPQCGISTRFNL